MKIFTLSPDREIMIDNVIFLMIPDLYKVWTRKTPMKGDADGRKKLMNFKELHYIFLIAEWTDRNPLALLPEEEKHEKAIYQAGLQDDWKIDSTVELAISAYKRTQLTLSPSISTLISVKKSLSQAGTMLKNRSMQNEKLVARVEKLTEEFIKLNPDAPNFNQVLIAINQSNELLQSNIDSAMNLANKVETAMERLDKLETKVRTEEIVNQRKIEGGRTLGNREDPSSYKFLP
jgi:hypothetical protein